jgi:hypothetical protein
MRHRPLIAAALAAAFVGSLALPFSAAGATPASTASTASTGSVEHGHGRPVRVQVLTPRPGDDAGIAGSGFAVDLALRYPSLEAAGFNGLQLTGPAGHANIPPLPGAFGAGADEKVPGLVVVMADATAGSGQNFAGVFNLTMVGDRGRNHATIQDTWLVGAPAFGTGQTKVTVAVVDDLDHNGVYDDAPNVVPDADGNGRVDARDLRALGVASNVAVVPFSISADPA